MKIYCFSGLGVDKRAFQYLELKPHTLIHIDWIPPLRLESLEAYAKRIMPKDTGHEPFALMGLSFGGMVSVEIVKHLDAQKLIVISSIISTSEMPCKYRIAGLLQLHKFLPFRVFKKPNYLTNYFFGARTPSAKKLLKEILDNTDFDYLKWAIGAMLKWNNTGIPNCIRIHGTEDHILPIDALNIDHPIIGGGHFMIVQKADELSKIIRDALGAS